MSTPLTFKELRPDEIFIGFPTDGDDHGHGGFREPYFIFTKLPDGKRDDGGNAVRKKDGAVSKMSPEMKILRVA